MINVIVNVFETVFFTIFVGERPSERDEGGLQSGSSKNSAQDHRLHRLQGPNTGQVGS